MKKLIPAIVMLLVSAVVLSTASYAWFSTTTTASADGMSVTAEAPSSVLIRQLDPEANFEAIGEFGASIDFEMDEAVVLTPASTVNGIDFFVPTKSEDAQGGMAHSAQIVDAENTNNTVYFYDFAVEVKNGGSSEISLVLSDLQITGPAIKDAVRVAILALDESNAVAQIEENTPYAGYNNTSNLGYVRYPTAEDEYEASEGPLYDKADKGGKAIDLSDDETVIAVLPAASDDPEADTSAIRLVIRVWIEGQSSVCVSRNANATTDVSIALAFAKFGETETNAQ